MFKNTYQAGFLSVLYSLGSKPLQIWQQNVQNGYIKRLTDNDINSTVLEISGSNVSTTYVTCPDKEVEELGIKLPFLVILVKNMKKYFSFEVQVLDDKGIKRRFRASNYQTTTKVKPFICTMPMKLDDGWNQIQFNLSDFTRRAYGTNYVETVRLTMQDDCRLRRGYFCGKITRPTVLRGGTPARLPALCARSKARQESQLRLQDLPEVQQGEQGEQHRDHSGGERGED